MFLTTSASSSSAMLPSFATAAAGNSNNNTGISMKASSSAWDCQKLVDSYMDVIPALMYAKDRSLNYVFFNHAMEQKLVGASRGQLKKGRIYSDFNFFDAPTARKIQQEDLYVMETGEVLEKEERIALGGELEETQEKWYHTFKYPLKDDQTGKCIGVCGYSQDITAQKLLENELRETKKRLEQKEKNIQSLLEASSSDLCLLDRTGKVLEIGPSFRKNKEGQGENTSDDDSKGGLHYNHRPLAATIRDLE